MRTKAIVKRVYQYLPYQYRLVRSLRNHKAYVPPKQVQVEITNLCNLKCTMCDRWKWVGENRSTADVLSTQRLLDLFNELASLGVEGILLTGGETLMQPDFVTLIRHLDDLERKITIFTNGTLMDRAKAEALAAANAIVFFSIDGVSETNDKIRGVSGTFDKAIEGIRNLVNARKEGRFKNWIIINFTVQRNNVHDVVPIFNVANKIGVDTVTYNLVHGKPDVSPDEDSLKTLKENFQSLEKLAASSKTRIFLGDVLRAFIEENIPLDNVKTGLPTLSLFRDSPVPCIAAYTASFIDSFGRVFPCCYCYLDNFSYSQFEKERSRFCMGNILEKSFSEIWYGEKYNKFRATTDPVNAEDLYLFCGQCYDYFAFRKSYTSFPFFKKL